MESEFGPSKLGTKEYWDGVYVDELENYCEHGDEGEVWFGGNVVQRIVSWLVAECRQLDPLSTSVFDIGTGNGLFLVHLWKRGWRKLSGVDYCESAIDLANKIAKQHGAEIKFTVGNLLEVSEKKNEEDSILNQKFHICTDKGTFDAISLDPDEATNKKRIYVTNVAKLLQTDGLFVLTSCNWTKDELIEQFHNEFEFVEDIPMPRFQFGGKTGQTVTSIVLRKKQQQKH